MLMTVVRMPSYRMYWQTATRYDPIATVMGRKRFDNLRTYIHMNDNTNVKQKGEPGYDQGKIGMKQYIKNKPHKWGIKVVTRAGVTGLVYDFEVYTGKGTVTNERGLGVNGWLLYRRHLTQKQEKKYMPLLDFRVQVADALIKVGKQADLNCRKRGRRSLEDDPTSQAAPPPRPPPPPLQRISAPSVDVRLDLYDHFPIHAEKRG
ncbi:hypothetical protein F2P79_025976 [Pimephales promelas]|nr:hypothetical protein F2P79_025976 [Pimephales promelas]